MYMRLIAPCLDISFDVPGDLALNPSNNLRNMDLALKLGKCRSIKYLLMVRFEPAIHCSSLHIFA
jgi:hypothetical protein